MLVGCGGQLGGRYRGRALGVDVARSSLVRLCWHATTQHHYHVRALPLLARHLVRDRPTMTAREKTLICWSSGKDSAWSLHVLRQRARVEVVGLLTTVNAIRQRVSMHAVRAELLRAQAQAVGLPLVQVPIPDPCSNDDYAAAMEQALGAARHDGVSCVAFGDLFLQDVRQYREDQLRGAGLTPLFPLWGIPTRPLARTMVAVGLRARITCIDPKQLDGSFAGRDFDSRLLEELPETVDPCGERGEFHTFAYDGPMFRHRVRFRAGEIVERDGFVFADAVPE
jgi:uncharacterized protein (TIGR00290 family)